MLETVFMRSIRSSWLVSGSVLLATAASLFAGCVSDESEAVKTDLVITVGAEVVTSSTIKNFNFGAAKTTTSVNQVFTVSNVSDKAATIGGVTSADLALTPPFAATAAAAVGDISPCTASVILNPGQGCLLSVTFSPTALGLAEANMMLSFNDGTAMAEAKAATLMLKGDGLPPPAPILQLSVGAAIATTTTLTPFNFGSVGVLTSKSQVFTVSNTGDADAAIQGLASSELGLSEPFAASDTAAQAGLSPCSVTQVLAPGAGCLVAVTVYPTALGNFDTELRVSYVGPHTPQATQAKLKLLLRAILDCSISPELVASRAEGVQAAQDRMAIEAAQGTAAGRAAGEALTYVDGQNAGYSAGYNVGYNEGYDGPQGYDAGYPVGYQQGYNRGKNDVASCNQGRNAGAAAGQSAGTAAGNSDGYLDGYDDGFVIGAGTGYNDGYDDGRYTGASDGASQGNDEGTTAGAAIGLDDGYDDGYPIGYTDGYDAGTCSAVSGSTSIAKMAPTSSIAGKTKKSSTTAKAAPVLAAGTEDWVGQCYDQGYGATYNPNTYNNAYAVAYAAAKAANQQYQAGYAEAYPRGRAAGRTVGISEGYADGRADGDAAGFAVGSAEEYDRCYDNAYPAAYASAYQSAYNSSYNLGRADGIDDAYDAAYDNGYDDGYTVGFNSTYNPSYNAGFDAAYSSYYASGWNNGYDAGYDAGYDDADFDTCSSLTSAKAFSQSSRMTKARSLSKPAVAPAPTSIPARPAQFTSSKRVLLGKRVAPRADQTKVSRLKGYGTSWKLERFKTLDSKLPRALTKKWTPEQLKEFGSMRDLNKQGSLRQYLRQKNQTENTDGDSIKRRGPSISPKAKAMG